MLSCVVCLLELEIESTGNQVSDCYELMNMNFTYECYMLHYHEKMNMRSFPLLSVVIIAAGSNSRASPC